MVTQNICFQCKLQFFLLIVVNVVKKDYYNISTTNSQKYFLYKQKYAVAMKEIRRN